jgi:hypothetical protein
MYEGNGGNLNTAARDTTHTDTTGKGSLQAKTRSKKGARAADTKAAAVDARSVVTPNPSDNASLKRNINSCVQRRHPK